MTADRIFRAVIEDWESSAGYVAEPVDVNEELSGGARNADDFPRWIGIDAGVQRMVGLHGMLEEYFKVNIDGCLIPWCYYRYDHQDAFDCNTVIVAIIHRKRRCSSPPCYRP